MPALSGSYKPQLTTGAKTPKITNLVFPTSGTEENLSLQTGLRQLIIRSRGTAKLQFSFVSGESSTKFMTVPKNATFCMDALEFSGKILYIQADADGGIAEILELYT